MFLGVRSSLESGFGLKPPASSYRLIFTVVSKLLLLYSTIDKTSRLKMKSFSTVRVTQRGSQRYMEKRRGRRDLEDEASQIMSFSFLAILKSFLS